MLSNIGESQLLMDAVEQVAYSIARGKDGWNDIAVKAFGAAYRDETVTAETHSKDVYKAVKVRSEIITLAVPGGVLKGKAYADMTARSRSAQEAKLASAFTLGTLAAQNGAIEVAFRYACEAGGSKYASLCKTMPAMKAECAKRGVANVTLANLVGAVDVALMPEAEETASEAIAAIAKAFGDVAFGTDKAPSPHANAMSALAATVKGNGLARQAMRTLADMAALLATAEANHAVLPSEADDAREARVSEIYAAAKARVEAGEVK